MPKNSRTGSSKVEMTSRLSSRYFPCEANIAIIAKDKKKICAVAKKGTSFSFKKAFLFRKGKRVKCARANGMTSTRTMLSPMIDNGIGSIVPAKMNR